MNEEVIDKIVDHILYGDIHEEITAGMGIPEDELDMEQSTRLYCAAYIKRILTELFSGRAEGEI